MNIRPVLVVALVLLAVCLASLPGCYTVLKHPQQISMTNDDGGRRSCSDCHDQAHYYHDPYMYRYYDRYSYADRWYGYYHDPWWYDDYWYYDSWDGQNPALQTGGRTRWGSEPQRAPLPTRGATTSVGTPESGSSAGKPKTDSDGSGGSGSSSTADKNKRTRWGNEPARAEPPQKKTEPKKNPDSKEPKKKADDPNK